MFMFEVERVHVESFHQIPVIPDPHGAAVEVDQEPLVRVEIERVSQVNAVEMVAKLGTYERATSVGSVNVKPELDKNLNDQ